MEPSTRKVGLSRMSEAQAADLSVELWKWLAATGKYKSEWPRWEEFNHIPLNLCFLCEYGHKRERKASDWKCNHCPYYKRFKQECVNSSSYQWWRVTIDIAGRKHYAAMFLEELEEMNRCIRKFPRRANGKFVAARLIHS